MIAMDRHVAGCGNTYFSLIRRAGDSGEEEVGTEPNNQQDGDERLLITEATALMLGQPSTAEPLSTTVNSSIARQRHYAWTHLVILIEVYHVWQSFVLSPRAWCFMAKYSYSIQQQQHEWQTVDGCKIATVYAIILVVVANHVDDAVAERKSKLM